MALVVVLVIVLSFTLPERSTGTTESSGTENENVLTNGSPEQPKPKKEFASETERLLAEAENHLRTIKNCVVFFVVLTVISMLSLLIFYFSLSSMVGKIFG